jgi:hypothetical protein
MDTIDGDAKVLEAPCKDAMWHVKQCPPTSHVQLSTLQNTTNYSYIARIITKSTSIGVPTLFVFLVPRYTLQVSQILVLCR